MEFQTQSKLPVIDFTNENMKTGTETWGRACEVMRSAFEDSGCFLALYDKIPPELYNSVFSVMEGLFELPLETKKKKTSDKPHHGYYGQDPGAPLYESLVIDNPLSMEGCEKFTHIMWQAGNDRFCESVNAYAKLVAELDHMVKRMVFESYGLEKQKCDSFLESTNYVLRSYKYRAPKRDESTLGVHPHRDSTLVTILHQKIKGLEIKLKDGEWVEVDASPPLFVVLAGDAFVVWSNERMRACEHRVTMKAKIDRYGMGLLSYGADLVQTPEELIDEEHPRLYKPFDHYGYLGYYLTPEAIKQPSRLKAYCGV